MKQEVIKQLEKKYKKIEEELNSIMKKITIDNISENAIEVTYLQGMLQMLDETIFFLKEEVWEDELPIKIIRA